MRGRREKQIDSEIRVAAEFALALRAERDRCGLTYRQMAKSAHYSPTALSRAADGRKLPTWSAAEAYLRACGVAAEDLADWHERWTCTRLQGHIEQLNAGQPRAAAAALHPREFNPAGLDPPTAALLKMLHDLRSAKGLSVRRTAHNSAAVQRAAAENGREIGRLSSTRIHEVQAGRRPVDNEFVELFLLAVGADRTEQDHVGEANGYRLCHSERTSQPVRAVGRARVVAVRAVGRAPVPGVARSSWLTDSYVDELPPVPISPAPRRPARTAAVRSHRSPAGYHAPRQPRMPRPRLSTLRPVLSGSAGLLTISGTGILAAGMQPVLTSAASVDVRALAGAFLVLAGLMLLVLTAGLAYLVWIHRTTAEGRRRAAAPRNPFREAALTG